MSASGETLTIPLTPPDAPRPEMEAVRAEEGTGRHDRARLLRGGALFGFSQLAGMALGFGSGMVLVRVAEKPAVASYMLLQQAVMALGMALQLGLGPAALRFAPISRGKGGERATAVLRRRLFGLQIFLWGVVVPPLALAWPAIARKLDAPELGKATGFLLAAGVLASFGTLVDSYLRSFRLYRLSAPLTHLIPRGLILGGFVVLLYTAPAQEPWEMLAAVYVGALLTTSVLYALALLATTPGESSEPRDACHPPGYREILGTSTAMGLGSAGFALQMAGHHVRLLLLTLGGAALNAVLSFLLAPRWGGYGIAVATTVTLIVLNLALVRSARSLLGVRTFVYTRPAQWKRALTLVRESALFRKVK